MTRETIKEYILQVKSQDGTEALYNRWEPDILVEVINEIFNDHEAQLKAKDEEIERLKAELLICKKRYTQKAVEGKELKKALSIVWRKQLRPQR